jgi:autotransporter-associated beta strand protein
MRYTALAAIWPALIVLAAPADQAAVQSSNLYDGGGSVKIPYASGGVADSPTLHLSFDGADGPPVAFVMDTGSVGIIASPDNFTPGPNARNLGPGVQIYTSSGRVENGTWYTAQQFIYRGDTLVAVAEVPVLQVTSVTCLPDARDCQPSDHPTGIALMGIGFARENTTQPDPATHGPDYNAFLNLTQVRLTPDGPLQPLPADWHTGYVVTSEGVELGLTADNTAGAGLIKLLPDPTYSTPRHTEWVATPMVIDVNGASGAGTVLFDTGVGYGILTPPDGAPLGSLVPCPPPISNSDCLPDGAVIAVSLPGDTDPTAFYTFTVGDGTNPMAPANVAIFEATTGVFFNTSRHALTGLAYIFDSEHGFVGYRWLDTEGTTGSVRLAMALQGPFALPPGFRSELETILFAPTTLSPDGSSEFAGPILGPGGLTIDGRGKVVLSGTGTYSGPTTVSRGTLLVNGSILSPVTVERGGALGGSGLVGNDVTVLAGGIYAPGNSIGTQTVTGNFILESGAVFEVEVEPSGTSDRTIVTGSVDLTGAILKVLAAPGRYTPDTQYLIVDNQGTDPVIGRFARVNVNSPFLRPSVLYDGGTGNDVVLLLASDPGAFVDVARTRNERAVARALSGSEPDSALVESILPLSAAEANGAFNALSGEIHATVAGVLADDSRYLREAILGRLVQAGAAGSGDAELASLAAAGPQVAALDRNAMALGSDAASEEMSAPRGTLAVWTRAYGAWGDFDGNLNAAGAERDSRRLRLRHGRIARRRVAAGSRRRRVLVHCLRRRPPQPRRGGKRPSRGLCRRHRGPLRAQRRRRLELQRRRYLPRGELSGLPRARASKLRRRYRPALRRGGLSRRARPRRVRALRRACLCLRRHRRLQGDRRARRFARLGRRPGCRLFHVRAAGGRHLCERRRDRHPACLGGLAARLRRHRHRRRSCVRLHGNGLRRRRRAARGRHRADRGRSRFQPRPRPHRRALLFRPVRRRGAGQRDQRPRDLAVLGEWRRRRTESGTRGGRSRLGPADRFQPSR